MKATLLLLFCCISTLIHAQISGTVTDENNLPLPFASVFVKNSIGATTNEKGAYVLALKPGNYTIYCQYVGYATKPTEVLVTDRMQKIDIKLEPNALTLNEFTISAASEDPAYAMMRKAIAKRAYYKSLMTDYQCRTYIKGLHKLHDAPKKIMGRELGDMGGLLDSTRQGVIFLSESFSRLYFSDNGKTVREVMEMSKVSGQENAVNFNRATFTLFTLYDETTDLGRPVMSPLADNALNYYKFRLEGTYFNDQKQSIARIKVIPRRANDPVFSGYIELMEDAWSIYAIDLFVTGDQVLQPILDTINVTQTMALVRAPDTYAPVAQVFRFGFGIMGFKYRGVFTSVFSEYETQNLAPAPFARSEEFKVEEQAYAKNDPFWQDNRPIALTQEEEKDYRVKDSIAAITSTKQYMDSLDNRSNKWKPLNVITGYTWNDTWRHRRVKYEAPLRTILYNTVQGLNFGTTVSYTKAKDANDYRYKRVGMQAGYGISDGKLRAKIMFTQKLNAIHNDEISLSGGREAIQYNEENPIIEEINTVTTILYRRNDMKIYERDFLKLGYKRRLNPQFDLQAFVMATNRRSLDNTTDWSLRRVSKRAFSANDPLNPEPMNMDRFDERGVRIADIKITFYPRASYETYPDHRAYKPSNLPILTAQYRLITGASAQNGHRYRLTAMQKGIQMGIAGNFSWFAGAGGIAANSVTNPIDYSWFQGNEYAIDLSGEPLKRYQAMRYYDQSTKQHFVQLNMEHNFKGFFLDKIPLLKRLKATEIITAKSLFYKPAGISETSDQKGHIEFGFGLGNLGFGPTRIFRLDYVVSPSLLNRGPVLHRFVVGLSTALSFSAE
jgi:Family of unknown function (DUF5686)/CarboxypepD_reg-like domain